MAKIFVFGERLINPHLGYLSIDGEDEIKIKAKGVTYYEHPISAGKHTICFYTAPKFQRFLSVAGNDGSVLGTLGGALMESQMDAFEYEIEFDANDVLVLHVAEESSSKTSIQYAMITESEYQEKYKSKTQYTENNARSSGGCYVATAVYGSYDCPQVWTLRRYRDYTLAETWYGRMFIRFYYAASPTLVKWFGKAQWFKKLWKPKLDRMVEKLNAKGLADTPYQDKHW